MTDSALNPVIGESWTSHTFPGGSRGQIIAWLLAGWRPDAVVVITGTGPQHGVASGLTRFAHCLDSSGTLGHEQVMETSRFILLFRPIPDNPPDPQDVPPEVPR